MGTLASAAREVRRSIASSPGRRGQARLAEEASPAITQVVKADAVGRASVEVIGDGWEGKAPSGAGATNPSIARAVGPHRCGGIASPLEGGMPIAAQSTKTSEAATHVAGCARKLSDELRTHPWVRNGHSLELAYVELPHREYDEGYQRRGALASLPGGWYHELEVELRRTNLAAAKRLQRLLAIERAAAERTDSHRSERSLRVRWASRPRSTARAEAPALSTQRLKSALRAAASQEPAATSDPSADVADVVSAADVEPVVSVALAPEQREASSTPAQHAHTSAACTPCTEAAVPPELPLRVLILFSGRRRPKSLMAWLRKAGVLVVTFEVRDDPTLQTSANLGCRQSYSRE